MFMWSIKVDISILLMGFLNSKNCKRVGHRISLKVERCVYTMQLLSFSNKIERNVTFMRFFFLFLGSSNIEIYGMHSTILLFVEIVGLTF